MVGEHFAPEGFEFKQIPKTHLKECFMVAIRDSPLSPNNDCSVFPPINHENLHLPSQPNQQHPEPLSPSPSSPSLSSSSSSSLSSFSPSDSDESGPVSPLSLGTQVRKHGQGTTWIGIGVEVVRSNLFAMASSFGFDKVWCFASGAGMAAGVFMLLSLYLRTRQRRYRNHLKLIVKEKDEKINKLLHQIAQMNEVLVARHRVLASKLAN
ncbi:uncharacterized protein Pyn_22291 [Prunus yedoensis var. nudiflora]|uniref:Uncharacterized protein n=1 Tax=Prunus yedoensis var. nudiflora TaxID=2094558 RepID=A0A314ZG21_PRUYE|nr:uncharacterized protein Pyn_22291 [Prunus yedoensis var. nudiflora]